VSTFGNVNTVARDAFLEPQTSHDRVTRLRCQSHRSRRMTTLAASLDIRGFDHFAEVGDGTDFFVIQGGD